MSEDLNHWTPPDVIEAGSPDAPWCGFCGTAHVGTDCPDDDYDEDDE